MYDRHLLCAPTGDVTPALIEKLKSRRSHGRCASASEVRIKLPSGVLRFRAAPGAALLAAGHPVYVWWSDEAFVCASVQDVDAHETPQGDVGAQVRRAREALAQARRDRPARLAAELAHTVDLHLD